jgi:hypothetical protein
MIVEYELNADGTTPSVIKDGGFYPVGNTLIGIVKPEDSSSFTVLDKEMLIARLTGMDLVKSYEVKTEKSEAGIGKRPRPNVEDRLLNRFPLTASEIESKVDSEIRRDIRVLSVQERHQYR